ncbi:MAG: hypothetical protein H0X30_13930 [Anaerolineae bacterium]|nr:hypothetical protein [Anaerolineae bacterium]
MREQAAELTFYVGGTLAHYRRNDTNAADGSAVAAAAQKGMLLLTLLLILNGEWRTDDDMQYSPKRIYSLFYFRTKVHDCQAMGK